MSDLQNRDRSEGGGEKKIISFEANTTDYLTNKLQVVKLDTKTPNIPIGANYFLKFIQLNRVQDLNSEFFLLHTKIGLMIM